MKNGHRALFKWFLVALCITLWVSPAFAQEGAGDGRPAELQPGTIPPTEESEPSVAGETQQDTDVGVATAQGDISAQNQTISGDLFVVGGECVGIDCNGGESFSFVTIRLKENNDRIYFEDTSSSGEFPSNDWALVANDSSNGGLNRFMINDVDHGKTAFSVEAGLPNDALYVKPDGSSNASVGISHKPASGINLDIADGWTPYLRFQLTDVQGWNPYAWDVFANESNFIIQDTSGSGAYSFAIYPGAPQYSLFVGGSNRGNRPGYIGLGTNAPEAALHLAQPSTSWRERASWSKAIPVLQPPNAPCSTW